MKVLHYALGFPPYRSGGLTKFCMDLILAQKSRGFEIAMMWPGKFSLTGHFVRLKESIVTVKNGEETIPVTSFEVINPLPVSLDEGIKETGKFMEKCPNPQVFRAFLETWKPDVIHLHTLMGLHREFLQEAKACGIKIVFSSHDYFGICPKVTMFRNGQVCSGNCSLCERCNESALSIGKIKILQSGLYRALKDTKPVQALRKKNRQNFFEEASRESLSHESGGAQTETYRALRQFYIEMFQMVDIIHYNSTVTESVYRKWLPEDIRGKVISISHGNIKDNRKRKTFTGKLKMSFLAANSASKGYFILKQAMDELWDEGIRDFELNLFYPVADPGEYMKLHKRFSYEALEKIFDQTDLLMAPSVCYETFGFTVLEALNFGVPVMVSTNVGAKDLLENAKYGMVIEPTKDAVKQAVKYVIENREILTEYNRRIVEEMNLDRVINFVEQIDALYG